MPPHIRTAIYVYDRACSQRATNPGSAEQGTVPLSKQRRPRGSTMHSLPQLRLVYPALRWYSTWEVQQSWAYHHPSPIVLQCLLCLPQWLATNRGSAVGAGRMLARVLCKHALGGPIDRAGFEPGGVVVP